MKANVTTVIAGEGADRHLAGRFAQRVLPHLRCLKSAWLGETRFQPKRYHENHGAQDVETSPRPTCEPEP
jgi:hypothetical protein